MQVLSGKKQKHPKQNIKFQASAHHNADNTGGRSRDLLEEP
jgi:hypothetical protein